MFSAIQGVLQFPRQSLTILTLPLKDKPSVSCLVSAMCFFSSVRLTKNGEEEFSMLKVYEIIIIVLISFFQKKTSKRDPETQGEVYLPELMSQRGAALSVPSSCWKGGQVALPHTPAPGTSLYKGPIALDWLWTHRAGPRPQNRPPTCLACLEFEGQSLQKCLGFP